MERAKFTEMSVYELIAACTCNKIILLSHVKDQHVLTTSHQSYIAVPFLLSMHDIN
jgi:hypothetical protein